MFEYTSGTYTRDSKVSVMSLSKAVTAAVLLALIDENKISLTTTVGSLIPSWNNGQRATITLKQIISHTSGIPETGDFAGGDWTLATAVDGLATKPLAFSPGTQFVYATTSYQVAARMAEVVTGQTWKQVFESRIRNKCGMGDAQYMPGQEHNPNAGYGLYCSQKEYYNFYKMLSDNGMYNGSVVLSSNAVNTMFTNQTNGLGNWGFGVILNEGGNEPTSESAKGCYAWINREKDYFGVLFTQATYESTINSNNTLRSVVRAAVTTTTPPVNDNTTKYQLVMGTTGGGFQANATHGIDPQWVERIEACKYDWGWGITGICLWIGWDGYEPTAGNYQVAALNRAIQFCKDRGLTFSVAFMPRRPENENTFIADNQVIRGSNGTKYVEGVPGFGAVYPSYGSTVVHAKMTGAIQSIANAMKAYDKSFYVSLAGGGAGEQVNYVFQRNGQWEFADFSPENLERFETWRASRNLAPAGEIPKVTGFEWPHPDYTKPLGLEFGRFTTMGIQKAYRNLVTAVKSVAPNLKCIYFYSVTSNLQFRAIQNPNLNYIAAAGDGMYGSDGDGLGELFAKIKVNSINMGTFPNGISATEVDPDDISNDMSHGTPPYCAGNLNYNAFLQLCRDAFSRGLQVMHFAMAFCPSELRGFDSVLKTLHNEYLNKPYIRPSVNSSNTVTVEVTQKYRTSQDLMQGIDPYTKYTKYTDNDFWGGIPPE